MSQQRSLFVSHLFHSHNVSPDHVIPIYSRTSLHLCPLCLAVAVGSASKVSRNPFKMPPEHELFVLREKERQKLKEVCLHNMIKLYFAFMQVCLSVCLPVCLSACLSVCLSVCLSICQPACGKLVGASKREEAACS